jgi:hypothetical protein
MSSRIAAIGAAVLALQACGALTFFRSPGVPESSSDRDRVLARAQLWIPTDIRSLDLKRGPPHPGAFRFRASVRCHHRAVELGGVSPKFACVAPLDDLLKVKYGGNNAEVYGEVAASRLLWALGFGADRMYPVRIICRDCPADLGGWSRGDRFSIFDPALIERQMPGRDFAGDDGWAWSELERVRHEAGGAPRAQVDALRLLAVLIQHTDSKAENQRLICLGAESTEQARACTRPFLLVHDVGLTFGAANRLNDNDKAMNLAAWTATDVWKDASRCIGNLPRSFSGTLEDPVIGEAGRAFLARLLMQLSDTQLRQLFDAARVHLRLRDPEDIDSGFARTDEWIATFKRKRQSIVDHRCEPQP